MATLRILKARNPHLVRLGRLSARRRARDDEGAFVVDGPMLVAEALDAGLVCTDVFVDPDRVDAAIRALIPDARTGVAEGGPGDPLHLDTTRLREDTGFRPSYDAGRAVGDYVGWLRAGHTR